MAKKAVLRTAQDILALDKAFFLIEGHPSYSLWGSAMTQAPKGRLENQCCPTQSDQKSQFGQG
jgi:hypothetical protein